MPSSFLSVSLLQCSHFCCDLPVPLILKLPQQVPQTATRLSHSPASSPSYGMGKMWRMIPELTALPLLKRQCCTSVRSDQTCGRERRGIPGAAGVGAARGCVTAVGRSRRGVPALLPAEGGSERAAVVPFPSGRSAMTAVRSGRRSRRAPGSRGSASVDLMP